MAKTIVITDEQIKALTEAAEGQLGALDGVDRIYLAPKFQAAFMKVFVEVLKASVAGGSTGQTVDAYTKQESDSRYLATNGKAESAKTADTAINATSDGLGRNIADTYAKAADLTGYVQTSALTDYVTTTKLNEILQGYQPVSPAA